MNTLNLDFNLIKSTGSIGSLGSLLYRINNSLNQLFSGIFKFVIVVVLAIPVLLVALFGIIVLWFKFWRMSKNLTKQLGLNNVKIEIHNLEDFEAHTKARQLLNDNLVVFNRLIKHPETKLLKKIPLVKLLVSIVEITAVYCKAVDVKTAELETTEIESTFFSFVSKSELDKTRNSAYPYLK